MTANKGFTTFKSFYNFLVNAGMIPTTQDAVFHRDNTSSVSHDSELTLPTFIPEAQSHDQ